MRQIDEIIVEEFQELENKKLNYFVTYSTPHKEIKLTTESRFK